MKILKYLFLLILVVFIAGSIYISLKDGKYDITESRTIPAPASLLYSQSADFQNWDNWNPWLKKDDVTVSMGEQTAGVDGNYSFTDEYGKGVMTYTSIDPNKSLVMDMHYTTSMTDSHSDVTMNFTPADNGTEVSWNIKGEQDFMTKVLFTLSGKTMEEELRPMYKKGLKGLENHVSAQMDEYSVNIDGIKDNAGGYYLYTSSSTTMEQFSTVMTQMMQNIMSYMSRNKIDMYGKPMAIYEKMDVANRSVIFSAAIPVQDRVITATDSNVLSGYRPPFKAVKITLKGKYSNLEEAWKKGNDYLVVNGLTAREDIAPYEIYKTDPLLTPNPADFITEIYMPIQQ